MWLLGVGRLQLTDNVMRKEINIMALESQF